MRTFYLCLISLIVIILIPDAVQALIEKTESVQISSGKKTVKYISFHPSEEYTLKPVLAGNKVGHTAELVEMAKDNQAVAAINGTFFNAYNDEDLQPMGAIMIHREAVHIRGGAVAMGISGDGKELTFATDGDIKIFGGINGSRVYPNKWYAWFMNHLPSSEKEIVVFTSEFRSTEVSIPEFDIVVVNKGKVVSIAKDHAAIPANGFLIAYGPAPENKSQLDKFKVGDTAEYWVEYPDELSAALHMISVGPKLVSSGQIDVDFERDQMSDPKLTAASGQRSFIGYKKDGTIVMGTVGASTILQMAEVLRKLGLYEAMNLDGGASSGLYSNGSYLTQPGRKLSNSLVLLKQKKSPRVLINETEIFFKDAIPFIEDGTTMVPVRGVFEELGAALEWNGKTETVTAKRFDAHIELTVGKLEAKVNGEINTLRKAPVNINGRVYIPLRFVSEALGAQVGWEQKSYTVAIGSDILTARFHLDAGNALATDHVKSRMEQFELAVRLDPTLEDAWKQLAFLYSSKQDYEKTVYAYQQIHDVRISNALGWAAYNDGQFDIAVDAFTAALNVKDLVVGAHYGLGVTYMHNAVQKREKAIFHLEKVIELDPNGSNAQRAEELLK